MDDKLGEGVKPKITRSRARHIRRKRLLSARRAAEKEPNVEDVTNIEVVQTHVSESPKNREVTESLSKSKARRLRKRNKTKDSKDVEKIIDDTTEVVGSCSRVVDVVRRNSSEDIVQLSTKSSDEKESLDCRNNTVEFNSITREAVTGKITASEHELFENEKNLNITKNLRPCFESQRRITEDYQSGVITIDSGEDTDFIVNDDDTNLRIINESENDTGFSSIIIKPRLEANNDFSLSNLTNNVTTETVSSTKISKTIDAKMSSQEKSREQVKAEREAKKAAKTAAKNKVKVAKTEVGEIATTMKSKPEVVAKNANDTKGDVVDGEVVPTTNKLTTTSMKKKPDIPNEPEVKNDGKSKAELRAERRAKQEAQRAAKQGQAQEKVKPKIIVAAIETTRAPRKVDELAKKIVKRVTVNENAHEVNLFKHLYHEREQAMISVPTVNSNIHPAIVRLGVQYADKVIVGSNARCVALLAAVKQLIQDFERPPQADFTRGLETSLQESSAYLHHCRPLAVSMQNALRHLKWQMTQLSATTSDDEAKTKLGNAIDTYIQEQIQLADKAISITIQTKISNGDVILTYGYSSLIYKILCDAHDAGRQFRVVVVDGRPWLEGREQLRRLAKHGLECSYVLINALSFIMPEVSKVFLGAHAILANGAVMSRVGTAQVALMAKSFNVPVLVACETHKTCERVQTDSIVYNEIADADELAQNLMGTSKKPSLINWRGKKSLNLLNITYDVTPADLVTAVVTELAILPCTSVPVILRIKPSEI